MSHLEHRSLRELIDIFKEDYSVPTKAIVLAKVLKEWGRFIAFGTVLFLMTLLVILSGDHKPNTSGLEKDHQIIISNLRSLVTFMDLSKRSVNERQALYARLVDRVDMYAGDKPEQGNIEGKIRTLSSIASLCNTTRDMYMRDFSRIRNPLTDPEIAASYTALSNPSTPLLEHQSSAITAQSEQQQWDLLCTLCANEVQKANKELSQLIKARL